MKNNLKIRAAEKSEIGWVNNCYDEVEFVHSDFDNEIIAIAEFDGQKAGLGRLVRIDDKNLELGGMYVFESFRGKGIAKKLVEFLLENVKPFQIVYCIPFEHLLSFYKQCGFTTCSNFESVPKKILDKFQWCKEKYANPTALLMLESFRKDKDTRIRFMCTADIENIANNYCLPWSTVQETKKRWDKYYKEEQKNIRTVGVVEKGNEILGYGSLFLKSEYSHFSNIPEIHDVWIYEEHRGRGLGSQLIAWLEGIAKEKGYKEIGIGVGLYADYGPAQKLYFRLGYAPDGYGITYKYQPTTAGQSYPLDDDLILWMKKLL